MTTIHLIRHGQTNWNVEKRIQGQTDSVLTDEGHIQAKDAGEKLKHLPVTVAYASSSIRTRDTASHILHHHNVDLNLRDELREIYLASWEGNLYEDMKETEPTQHRHFWEDPSQFAIVDGETFYDVQARAVNAVKQIVSDHAEEEILLVSHGVWIKTLLTYIEKRPLSHFWHPPKMTNCCHSIVTHDGSDDFAPENFTIHQYGNLTEWDTTQ
ncbi:histidine phosphatase family protein [Aurantivibrio plasticivorans]